MKLPIAVALSVIALSYSVPAQVTDIQVKPAIPVECDLLGKQDHAHLNQVFNIEKVHEDSEQVTFAIETRYGSCDDGVFNARYIDAGLMRFFFEKKKFSLFGSSEKGVISRSETKSSPTEVLVQLTFDKKFAFKSGDKRSYYMIFQPGVYRTYLYQTRWGIQQGYYPLQFWWTIRLTRIDAANTSLAISVGQ